MYHEYYGGNRKERYEAEKDRANGLLYFGELETNGSNCNELIEDINGNLEVMLVEKELMELLRSNFTEKEVEMIERHFIDGETYCLLSPY